MHRAKDKYEAQQAAANGGDEGKGGQHGCMMYSTVRDTEYLMHISEASVSVHTGPRTSTKLSKKRQTAAVRARAGSRAAPTP